MAKTANNGKRKIVINPVTRIEGHGKVTIVMDENNNVEQARFHIIEFRGLSVLPRAGSTGKPRSWCSVCAASAR